MKRLNTAPFHGVIHGFESRTSHHTGVWFSGRTAVSKTVDGSSILSTPAIINEVFERRLFSILGIMVFMIRKMEYNKDRNEGVT